MVERELFDGVTLRTEKNKIVFYADRDEYPDKDRFRRKYTDEGWKYILELLLEITKEVWPDLKPKEATGIGSDFEEYYDKEIDLDGSMSLFNKELFIHAPSQKHPRIYAITKRKGSDFINTLLKRLAELEVPNGKED